MTLIKELKILGIEDNPYDFTTIENYLKKELTQCTVDQAKTFAQAKKILVENNTYNAILLDLSLPDAKGEALAKEVLKLADTTPVILLTEYSVKDFGAKVISLGISDYLSKENLTSTQLFKSISYSIELKRIVTELEVSKNKYNIFFHMSPLPLWVYDMESLAFLDVNEAAIKKYGYSKEEFLSMTLRDIREPKELKNFEYLISKFNKTSDFYKGHTTHLKKNGEVINVEIQRSEIDFEGRKAGLVHSIDITEKVKIEDTLLLKERRFEALVQDGLDLTGIVDFEGNYIYVSPNFKTILGLSPEELIGKNAFDYLHEEDKERVINDFSLVTTEKWVKIYPFRFRDGDNNYRWIETIATNMYNNPSIHGVVINSRDISERMNYIQAIEAQNTKLKEIAWIQSHMVRAPLARIMGLVNLLKSHSVEEISGNEILEHISNSTNELDNIIRTIVKKAEQIEKETDQ